MDRAIGDAVGRTVVSRGAAHRDAQQAGILKCLVVTRQRLAGPRRFRAAPTDRDHRRFTHAVVDGGGDRVEKSLVGVGCEVDGDFRVRSDRADDLYIQQHLAVGAVGVAGRRVGGAIHRDGRHAGSLTQPETGEVRLQVGAAVSASQLDNGHGLTGAGSVRVVVQFGDRVGRVRNVARRTGPNSGSQPSQACSCLRPLV